MRHIFIFTISFFLISLFSAQSQTSNEAAVATTDTLEKFGLRVGVDLSKPLRTLLDENYSGFEIMGDYRVYKDYYAAVELGNEQKTTFDDKLTSKGDGSYIKIGFDYNAHNNWPGLNNSIHTGLRYGLSTFNQELLDYSIANPIPIFPEDLRTTGIAYDGLTAHWVELVVGVKAEVLNNVFLSLNFQIKRRLGNPQLDNFEALYIPGFGRTYENSQFGAGFGYGISYLIPIYKK